MDISWETLISRDFLSCSSRKRFQHSPGTTSLTESNSARRVGHILRLKSRCHRVGDSVYLNLTVTNLSPQSNEIRDVWQTSKKLFKLASDVFDLKQLDFLKHRTVNYLNLIISNENIKMSNCVPIHAHKWTSRAKPFVQVFTQP